MLRFAILERDIRGKLRVLSVRGKNVELTLIDFTEEVIREIREILPRRKFFYKKRWKQKDIERALIKAIDNVAGRLKRETIKM